MVSLFPLSPTILPLTLSFSRGREARCEDEDGWAQERTVADLHSDYINPIDLCNRLNGYIIPEAGVHAFLTFLFLINGYWVALLLNLPLVAFNVKKYVSSPFYISILQLKALAGVVGRALLILNRILDNAHLLDATEIFRKLNVHKKV